MKKKITENRLQSPVEWLIKKVKPVLPLHEKEYASIFHEAREMENRTAQQLVDMGAIFLAMEIDKYIEKLDGIDIGETADGLFKSLRIDLRNIINKQV